MDTHDPVPANKRSTEGKRRESYSESAQEYFPESAAASSEREAV